MYLPVTNLIKGKTPKMHNNREESSADRRLVPHHQSRSKQRRPSNPEITAESSRGRREDISRRSDPTPSRHSMAVVLLVMQTHRPYVTSAISQFYFNKVSFQ